MIQQLRQKISFKADPEMHAAYYRDYRYGARVRIRMDDGREHVEERLQLLGARDRPFDHAEKFREGAAHFLGGPATERALATLRQLHAVDDVRAVMDQFKPH